ncbi:MULTISPECIES: ECF transporter S component [Enterococcus]|uniref:Riboflavin transporter n=1 Tax=Enterococcus thailandicus TaxID=417368 RepID=A0A179EP15_ENTTH|nr:MULTISPECIES: ECF transporter S component [Enterococcus]ASZ07156.1 ECF transporter S component [Enterococcus thailandicus]MDA3965468.1 ECF transporter S component [Enterococcus thailandicus]MDA3974492.1 ECF transporter S component [Enterococcus thailandicus]MDA3976979.1 ECF transporter S component [Enterococcus thailandicus]MDA3981945.1 ECF transporter S component [Enterococcus thailandicus]
MKNTRVQKMVMVAMFAAIGLVLQFIAFPIMPAFSFLKIDFSDIPVLISMFLFGPVAGVATAFLRSLLHLVTTGFSPDNLVGDVASFLATTIFTLPIFYFFKQNKKHANRNKILGVVTGTLAMTIFMSIANYFVITPLYLMFFGLNANQMLGMPLVNYVLIGIVPFNLIKGFIVSAAFLVLHAKLLPWLSRKQHALEQRHTI